MFSEFRTDLLRPLHFTHPAVHQLLCGESGSPVGGITDHRQKVQGQGNNFCYDVYELTQNLRKSSHFKSSLVYVLCPQILFISVDVTLPITHMLNYFGVSKDDAPTARLINMETGKKFSIDSNNLNVDSLTQLCHDVLDGSAKVTHVHTRTGL